MKSEKACRPLPDTKPLEEAGQFKVVVVDPPWPSTGYLSRRLDQPEVPRKKRLAYPLMSVEEIADLPIGAVLEPDAFVFLWTINRFMPEAYSVLCQWGLKYRFTMAWVKSSGPKPTGYPTYNMEQILVGVRGSPKFSDTRAFRTAHWWEAPRTRIHSGGAWRWKIDCCAKPDGFYQLVSRATEGPRLDVFGRRRIPGFYSWGSEAPKGEPTHDYCQIV